jgi:chromosome segregation ATPase
MMDWNGLYSLFVLVVVLLLANVVLVVGYLRLRRQCDKAPDALLDWVNKAAELATERDAAVADAADAHKERRVALEQVRAYRSDGKKLVDHLVLRDEKLAEQTEKIRRQQHHVLELDQERRHLMNIVECRDNDIEMIGEKIGRLTAERDALKAELARRGTEWQARTDERASYRREIRRLTTERDALKAELEAASMQEEVDDG